MRWLDIRRGNVLVSHTFRSFISKSPYQQKISADFMIELLHENDLDDGDELPGLNNDEIADRDELVEVVFYKASVLTLST